MCRGCGTDAGSDAGTDAGSDAGVGRQVSRLAAVGVAIPAQNSRGSKSEECSLVERCKSLVR